MPVKQVVDIAINEIDYIEKKSPNQLDSKTANAGYNNYTKYARDMSQYNAGIYANGYPWCDTFVHWCFVQAFGKEWTLRMIHGWSAYTPTSADYYKKNGEWFDNPQAGDQIFFKNSKGTIFHTGLVYKADDEFVYTIEGNTSATYGVVDNGGMVKKKYYYRNYKNIAGYGRPRYPTMTKGEVKMIYNWVDACPEWSQPYVRKAWDLGWIRGDLQGNLNLTDDKIWAIIVLLRALNIMD